MWRDRGRRAHARQAAAEDQAVQTSCARLLHLPQALGTRRRHLRAVRHRPGPRTCRYRFVPHFLYSCEKGGLGLKRVVSVSLGSSRRDHSVRATLFGQDVELTRRGCDGDMDRAIALVAELDGHVDAIGLGGLDVYIFIRGDRYVLEDGMRLMRAATRTPVTDGSGCKRHLEPAAVRWLAAHGPFPLNGARVLMVSALDRFGMAAALTDAGCDMTFGDLMFVTGVPYPIHSLAELEEIARRMAREIVKLPIHMIYPVGAAQEAAPEERFPEAYHAADVIAGDFHLIRRFVPPHGLDGKAVLTNTTTAADRELLRARGIRYVVTTSPVLDGRTFGNNVLEAALCAALTKVPEELTADDYGAVLAAADYRPAVIDLGSQASRG